jgi:hypothetical protein
LAFLAVYRLNLVCSFMFQDLSRSAFLALAEALVALLTAPLKTVPVSVIGPPPLLLCCCCCCCWKRYCPFTPPAAAAHVLLPVFVAVGHAAFRWFLYLLIAAAAQLAPELPAAPVAAAIVMLRLVSVLWLGSRGSEREKRTERIEQRCPS